MRKLNTRMSKDKDYKKLIKAKAMTDDEVSKHYPITRLFMLFTFYKTHLCKLFRYEGKSMRDRDFSKIDKHKLEQSIFNLDFYDYEITQLVGLYNTIYYVDKLDMDRGRFIVSATKNQLLQKAVNMDCVMVADKYKLILYPYVQDIKDRDLQHIIDNIILLTAVTEVMYTYMNDIKKEVIREYYSIADIKKMRTYLAKFKNRVPKILQDITGVDIVSTIDIKEKLEQLGYLKYDVKGV